MHERLQMTTAILHIGLGKCGSSALQSALSANPVLKDALGKTVTYAAITNTGRLLYGRDLTRSAEQNNFGYQACVRAALLNQLQPERIAQLAVQMEGLVQDGGSIFLSNEGWCNERSLFEDTLILKRLNLQCRVLVYVRPQVDWLNSAWWQWGAWTGLPFDHWFDRNLEKICWHDNLSLWGNVSGVDQVTIRLLPKDIGKDVCELLDVSPLNSNRSNSGSSAVLLRLFQRYRHLRPGPDDSSIEFILARHLRGKGSPTPWVLRPKLVEKIVNTTRECNIELLKLLDAQSRKIMQEDPRWWDASAFSDRASEPPEKYDIQVEQLEDLTIQAINAIMVLDSENRRLRRVVKEA